MVQEHGANLCRDHALVLYSGARWRAVGPTSRAAYSPQGIGIAFLGLVVSALICHYLFYLVPGLLGLKTGLPLYIVGASTYGARGGFLMPAFLMGVLQFGWLGVNSYFSSNQIAAFIGGGETGGVMPKIIAVAFAVLARVRGFEGHSVRRLRVATFVPLVPLSILVLLLAGTWDGLASFDADALVAAAAAGGADASALSTFGVLALCITYVVGFFATAGRGGGRFRDEQSTQGGCSNGRTRRDRAGGHFRREEARC